jgi:tetratricopeptide (TPR) repeat protein
VGAFLKTLQLDPTYPGANLNLGRIYHQRHEGDKARRYLRNEHMLMPSEPQVLMELSNLLLDTGETAIALNCLKRLTEKEPSNANAWQNLAVAFFHSDRYDEGILASKEALRCDSSHLMAMYNLAVAYEHLGKFDEALSWCRTALGVDPRESTFQKLELRLRVMQLRARVVGAMRRVLRLGRKTQVS